MVTYILYKQGWFRLTMPQDKTISCALCFNSLKWNGIVQDIPSWKFLFLKGRSHQALAGESSEGTVGFRFHMLLLVGAQDHLTFIFFLPAWRNFLHFENDFASHFQSIDEVDTTHTQQFHSISLSQIWTTGNFGRWPFYQKLERRRFRSLASEAHKNNSFTHLLLSGSNFKCFQKTNQNTHTLILSSSGSNISRYSFSIYKSY